MRGMLSAGLAHVRRDDLMKKGLRREVGVQLDVVARGSKRRPNEKGIKTGVRRTRYSLT